MPRNPFHDERQEGGECGEADLVRNEYQDECKCRQCGVFGLVSKVVSRASIDAEAQVEQKANVRMLGARTGYMLLVRIKR